MIINLYPVVKCEPFEAFKAGSALIINGEVFDFSPMTEGATLPRSVIMSDHFNDDVQMINGDLIITLIMPIPSNYSPAQAFPQPLVGVPDGPVLLPQPLPEALSEPLNEGSV